MEDWERKLDADLDLLADAYDALDDQLHVLSGEPPTQIIGEYARQLAQRWQRVCAPVNEVVELPGSIYSIKNYNYDMFCWFKDRRFKGATMTSYSLNIPQGELTPTERKQFQKRLH